MTGFGEVIESYAELAESVVRQCGEEAKRTATSVGAGTFGADEAASTAVRVVTLGMYGLFQLGGLVVGADRLSNARSRLRPLRVPVGPIDEERTVGPVKFQHVGFSDTSFGAHADPNPLPKNAGFVVLKTDHGRFPRHGFYVGTLDLLTASGDRMKIEGVVWKVPS